MKIPTISFGNGLAIRKISPDMLTPNMHGKQQDQPQANAVLLTFSPLVGGISRDW
jgi:hypothetical protein